MSESETSTRVAPSRSSTPSASRTAFSTPGSMPLTAKYSFGTPRRSPFTPLSSSRRSWSPGRSTIVASRSSLPKIVSHTIAASSTVFVNGPTWSRDEANATTPQRGTRPYVGFMPTTPQSAAGWRIEPPVSVPSAKSASPAATATAEPPDDPPGTRSARHGFFTAPNAEFSFELPMANSSRFVFPIITAPVASRRSTTVAEYGGTYPSRMREPAVVTTPFVPMMSLHAHGMPASVGGLPPPGPRPANHSSTARACARA